MDAEYLSFIKELPKNFQQMGAVIPSSPVLARAMIRPIRKTKKDSLRILEVGPGTGPFTRRILKLMRPQDRLLVCEINPRFLEQLQNDLQRRKHFIQNQDRVEFFKGPVQALPTALADPKFDVIVSSLPFSNFTPDCVKEILEIFLSMMAPGGSLTFCEYVGLRKLSRLLSGPTNRARVKGVDLVVDTWLEKVTSLGKLKREISLLNIPPAFTYQLDYLANGHSLVQSNGSSGNGIHFNGNGAYNGNGHSNGHGPKIS